jgi:hypothetical protein
MLTTLQWYISATIGFATILQLPFELPPLLIRAAPYVGLDFGEKLPFLFDLLRDVLQVDTGSIPAGGWPDAWWEELPTASFPEITVSSCSHICSIII